MSVLGTLCDKIQSSKVIHRVKFILAYVFREGVHNGAPGKYGSMQPKQEAKRYPQLKTQSRKNKNKINSKN